MGKTEQVLMSDPNDNNNNRRLEFYMLCLSMNRQAILPAQMDPFSTLKNLMYAECMLLVFKV